MREWEHDGGFSLDATVRIEARDRKGLEPCSAIVPARSLPASGFSARSRATPDLSDLQTPAGLLARIDEVFPLVGPG
jgi:hypothetical protein